MTRSDYSAHPLQMSAAPGRAAPGLCFFPLYDRVLGGSSVLYYYYLYMVCGETC